jgi:hypothetical protein
MFRQMAVYLMVACCLLEATTGNAQATRPVPPKKCGSEFNLSEVLRDPAKARRYRDGEARVNSMMRNIETGVLAPGDTLEIPVVFHIVSPTPNTITNEMIQRQLDIINRDFAGKNVDSTNAPQFYNIRGHGAIRFVLAKRSPEGCDTIGITRTTSNLFFTTGDDNIPSTVYQVKYTAFGGRDAWDSYNCKYLNIWIGTFTDGTLGQGVFPDGDEPDMEHGVVIDKKTLSFAWPGSYNYGRTLTHELGHYFKLYHIWGDDQDEPNRCIADDEIGDTPKQKVATYGKNVGILTDSCTPVGNGINYQNYMDYSDDSTLTMFTNQQVARVIATIYAFDNRKGLVDPDNKALEPVEGNELFNQCNTPEFTTNDFTCIGVGKGGVVWAGTANSGLYNYRGGRWYRNASYSNNLYHDIKADKYGDIWIAQSGYNGAQATTGGLLYFDDTLLTSPFEFYSFSNGLPSRYPRGIFIDTTKTFTSGLDIPLLFTANFAHITAGTASAGGIGRGFNPVAPTHFTRIRTGMQPSRVSDGTGSIYIIGGDSSEIWTHTQNNYGKSQILRHKNTVLVDTLPSFDTDNVLNGLVPSTFNAKAIYFDARGQKWITVNGSGIIVANKTNTEWKKINFAQLFPAGFTFNNNAIAGDAAGNVYFGTTAGLIVYRKGSPVDSLKSYNLYTIDNGLPSNNIKNIAVDTARKKLLIATQSGIIFWNPACANGPASDPVNFSTTTTGDWNNPAIWCTGVVPPPNAKIIVRHPVTITTDTHCQSLQLVLPGSFTVAPGVNFSVGN